MNIDELIELLNSWKKEGIEYVDIDADSIKKLVNKEVESDRNNLIKIKENLIPSAIYGRVFMRKDMLKFRGRTVAIGETVYYAKGDIEEFYYFAEGFWWHENMVERITIEMNKEDKNEY